MKSHSAVPSSRCSYTTAAGRRCRSLSSDSHSGLCPQHLLKQSHVADLTEPLLTHWQGFQTAQGVNFTLSNLYKLLAANRISTRRASVLAYINSLLLRTLPAIDADRAAGVKVPAAFREQPIPISADAPQEENAPTDLEEEDRPTEAEEPAETDRTSPDAAETGTATQGDTSSDWPDAIPEPDPNKKPS